MTQIKELRELIGTIRDRVENLCKEKCEENGIDMESVFSSATSDDGTLHESDEELPANGVDAMKLYSNYDNSNGADASASDSENDEDSDGNDDEDFTISDYTDDGENADELEDGNYVDMTKGAVGSGLATYGGAKIVGAPIKKTFNAIKNKVTKDGTKQVAKTATKAASKAAGKSIAKTGAKIAGKSLLKGIPVVGSLVGVPFAIRRLMNGDKVGAAMEVASGLGGLSTSLGMEAALAARDAYRDSHKFESCCSPFSLYDRAKFVFESTHGINESGSDYGFDDYVKESKVNNRVFVSESSSNDSSVFFGYNIILESTAEEETELRNLISRISRDGKITADELVIKDTDSYEIRRTKEKLRILLNKVNSNGRELSLSYKDAKKMRDLDTDSDNKNTNSYMWHSGLEHAGNAVNRKLSEFMIPQSVSKKYHIPANIAKLAGAGIGGLMFGPLGAIGGTMLANAIANGHEKYKTDRYNKLHGTHEEPEKSKYAGSLVGAGIGSLLGGPVGGIIGAGIGKLGQKALDKMSSSDKE